MAGWDGVPQYTIPGVAAASPSAPALEWPRGNRRHNRYHPQCSLASKAGLCFNDGRTVIVPDAVSAGTVGVYSFNEFVKGVIVDRSGNGNHGIAGPSTSSFLQTGADPMLSSNYLSGDAMGPDPRARKGRSFADTVAQSKQNPIHAPSLPSAPDRTAGAASAAFYGKTFYRIPPSESIAAMNKSFTAELWLSLGSSTVASAAGACPFFALGDVVVALTSSRHINLAVPGRSVTTSAARVRAHVWTHVTLGYTAATGEYSLIVNGIPDIAVKAALQLTAESPVYVGGMPGAECSALTLFVDDLTLSTRPPAPARVAAAAAVALGAVEPDFVQVGCARNTPCVFEEARKSCLVGFRLCSERELGAHGAYKVARQQGWLTWNDPVWTSDAAVTVTKLSDPALADAVRGDAAATAEVAAKLKAAKEGLKEAKAALCCRAQ